MTALSANYEAQRRDGQVIAYAVAAGAHIYKGALVCVTDATGYAAPAADAAGVSFVGIAYEEANNTGGAAGAMSVRVLKTGTFVCARAGASQADIDKTALVIDDNTVTVAATTHNIAAGAIVGVPDSAHVRIRINSAVK